MKDTILVAIVSMVSTFIGAAISAGTNYLVSTRTEKATEKREKASRLVEINKAARLIHAELLRLETAASVSIDNGHWYDPTIAKLSTAAWEKYSPMLAELPYDNWFCVLAAYENVTSMKLIFSSVKEVGLADQPILPTHLDFLRSVLSGTRLAKSALASYMGVPPPEFKKLG